MRIGVIGIVRVAGLAQAEPFVFQGSLNDEGVPANGMYDFQFILYDAETAGNQIGGFNILDDVEVINGTFFTELDFGDDAFDGSDRWVAIVVRDGDSTGAYVPLNPRAKIGNTPQAGYASKVGEAAALEDQFWTTIAPGVQLIGTHEGDDQIFINHNRAIEPTDVFVVHSSANAPGGMTVSTWLNGMPYYGYASGGFSRAKTYYDPITDAWVVSKGGQDLLEIDENNDVIITNNLIVNGTITSMNSGGGETLLGYKTYTPDTIFQSFSFERLFNSFAGAVEAQGSTGYVRMDVDLPHGALITNIHVEYVDRSSATNLSFELWTRDRVTLDFSSEVLATSSGFNANTVQVFDIVPDPELVIDNTQCTYSLRAFSTSSWPTVGNLGVRSVMIEYELTLP